MPGEDSLWVGWAKKSHQGSQMMTLNHFREESTKNGSVPELSSPPTSRAANSKITFFRPRTPIFSMNTPQCTQMMV